MKKSILLLISIISLIFLHAQDNTNNQPLTNEDFFTQAELVIEGYSIGYFSTYEIAKESTLYDTFTVEAIRVQKVFKGNKYLESDTIFVVSEGDLFGMKYFDVNEWDITYDIPALLYENGCYNCDVSYGATRIFFLTISDYFGVNDSDYSLCKKYKLLQNVESKLYVCENKILGLDNLVFQNREDFYNYMSQFEGYTIPAPEPILEKKQEIVESDKVIINDENTEMENYKNSILDSIKHEIYKDQVKNTKKKALKKRKNNRDYNTITFQIENQQFFYDYGEEKHYVKFDVLVSSNNPNIYLNDVYLEIKYNTDIFGTYVINNEKITVCKGEHFNNANDYMFYHYADFTNNTFCFAFCANRTTPPTRVTLDSIPTVFLHFEIELLPNLAPAESNFLLKQSLVSIPCNYTLVSNIPNITGNFYYYDDYFLINSDTIPVVTDNTPIITTQLNTISKIAGIKDTLTIEGYHFGNNKGNVLFSAADNGGKTFLKGLDDQFYVENWSDSLIKVTVPSRVYKGYEGDSPNNTGGAGSGKIKIITSEGDSCASTTSLQIPYSITNAKITNGSIQRVYLARKECDYDFQFTLHRVYENDSIKIAIIDTALHHWSALTGLILILERNSSGNLVFVDTTNIIGKNIIQPMGNSIDALMATARSFDKIILNNDTILYRTTGSHILIKDPPSPTSTWKYNISGIINPGERSFYQTFMHELGHILLLGHVNDTSQLMYYAHHPTPCTIINLTPSSIPVTAVQQTITASNAILWPAGFVKIPKITVVNHDSPLICNKKIQYLTLSSNYTTGNLWSTGETTQTIQVSSDGDYWLKNTEDICGITDTVFLIFSTANATFTINHVDCFENNIGSIITNPTGSHPPYSYQWTGNGINATTKDIANLTAGTYYLNLSNSVGCTANYQVVVTQPEELTVYFSQTPLTYEATVLGGTPPYEYYWSYVDGLLYNCPRFFSPNSPSIPLSYESPPCYLQLTVTDANGCQVDGMPSKKGKMYITENMSNEITLYPNPTSGSFSISNINDATVSLYSTLGTHIKTFTHVSNNETIDINEWANGIYFLKIVENDKIMYEKIILNVNH